MKALRGIGLLAALATSPAIAESRVYALAPFQRVSVSAGVQAVISIGVEQSVRAEAPDAATLDRLKVEVRNNQLEIGMDENLLDLLFSFGRHPPIVVHVTAPEILRLDASSGASVEATGLAGERLSLEASSGSALAASELEGARVTVNASSGASLQASGSCKDLVADASSGANVDAAELHCESLEASASSGGHIVGFASAAANAKASSGGSVEVRGNPGSINRDVSSGGSISAGP